MAKSLAELCSILGWQSQPAWAWIEIEGICEDTRRLRPGDLFVAIPGHDQDGSDFIARAIDRGARAVLSEEPLD
ncbi:MAG: Mur ligase domain-containing protein, partial [Candidatus Bipolaricaulota bacterium]